jgi:hypothetical protein
MVVHSCASVDNDVVYIFMAQSAICALKAA